MNDKLKLLELANDKIASDSGFMAYVLVQYMSIEAKTREDIIQEISLDMEQYYKLGLCKVPLWGSEGYLDNLNKIAVYVGISSMALNGIIKRVNAVSQFKGGNPENSYLMAARDKKIGKDDTDKSK